MLGGRSWRGQLPQIVLVYIDTLKQFEEVAMVDTIHSVPLAIVDHLGGGDVPFVREATNAERVV